MAVAAWADAMVQRSAIGAVDVPAASCVGRPDYRVLHAALLAFLILAVLRDPIGCYSLAYYVIESACECCLPFVRLATFRLGGIGSDDGTLDAICHLLNAQNIDWNTNGGYYTSPKSPTYWPGTIWVFAMMWCIAGSPFGNFKSCFCDAHLTKSRRSWMPLVLLEEVENVLVQGDQFALAAAKRAHTSRHIYLQIMKNTPKLSLWAYFWVI